MLRLAAHQAYNTLGETLGGHKCVCLILYWVLHEHWEKVQHLPVTMNRSKWRLIEDGWVEEDVAVGEDEEMIKKMLDSKCFSCPPNVFHAYGPERGLLMPATDSAWILIFFYFLSIFRGQGKA